MGDRKESGAIEDLANWCLDRMEGGS
jgi:hypothetical protein